MGHRPEGSNPCGASGAAAARNVNGSGPTTRCAGCPRTVRPCRPDSAPGRNLPSFSTDGVRKPKTLILRRCDCRKSHLCMPDNKAGPRTAWLSQPARNFLNGVSRTRRWMLPAPRSHGPRDNEGLKSSGEMSSRRPICVTFTFTTVALVRQPRRHERCVSAVRLTHVRALQWQHGAALRSSCRTRHRRHRRALRTGHRSAHGLRDNSLARTAQRRSLWSTSASSSARRTCLP